MEKVIIEVQPKPLTRIWLAAGAVALAVAAAVVVLLIRHGQSEDKFTVVGDFVLRSTSCSHESSTYDGYSDITAGTEVDVLAPTGDLVAYGQLGPGYPLGDGCTYPIKVENVPRNLEWYGVQVSHRGTVHFTYDQVLASGFEISLG